MAASATNSTAFSYPITATKAYKSASDNNPKSVEFLCNFWREEGPTSLDENGDTLLHLLAIHGNATAIKKLHMGGLLTVEGLRVKNNKGDTALHEAARFGKNRVSVDVLLEADKGLAAVRNHSGETPLYLAAAYGKKEAFLSLKTVSDCTTQSNSGCTILHASIMGKCYSLALSILELYPELAQICNERGTTALHLLATKPCSFKSGSKYVLKNLGMTTFIPVQLVEALVYFCTPSTFDKPQLEHKEKDDHHDEIGFFKVKLPSLTKFNFGGPWLTDIIAEKQKHAITLILAKKLIKEEIDWSRYNYGYISNPLIEAIKNGIDELAMEILDKHLDAANSLDENGRNLLHLAVVHKYRLIYEHLKKKTGVHKDRMLVDVDNKKNTILHLAADTRVVPQFPPGVTNQMTWDVFWFKCVENDVNPYVIHLRNDEGQTAEELFEEKHNELRKKAEKAVKDMNKGLMLVSALIATVFFAALFTVPGGFKDDGRPALLSNENYKENMKFLLTYIGSTIVASFFALACLLSIQLSRFHSSDFYIALPLKYVLAATALFCSTVYSLTTCMSAFIVEDALRKGYLVPVFASCIVMSLVYIDIAYLPFSYVSLALYQSYTRTSKKV